MKETYSRDIRLSDLFPSADRIAALVAHICILKEDFHLECRGLLQEASIAQLDQNTPTWRRTYFFRTFLRTLNEILNVAGILEGDEEVRQLLKKKPQRLQDSFKKLVEAVNPQRQLIQDLRNTLGGHVDHRTVRAAIANMDVSRHGEIQLGSTLGSMRYYFATELIVAILMCGIPSQDQKKELEDRMERIGGLIKPLLYAIDEVFIAYLDEQGLLDKR
jgi:hypothetical protein